VRGGDAAAAAEPEEAWRESRTKGLPDMFNPEEKTKQPGAGSWQLPLALLLIAALTVAVYWPALYNGFIDYDDTDYVTLNMMVRRGLTLKGALWSLGAFHAGNWHPLTWLSHMLDIQLFDLNPMGHHAVSLLLHAANAVLLCLLLQRLTGMLGRSLVVALLFALHPLHVESVAWIAERKDVLSTLFWLLTMSAYLRYVRTPCAKRYLTVALLFALGLMSKQMLVTLPLVLLLLDYWPLNRLLSRPARIIAEKIPLFLMSLAAALVTILAQGSGGALNHGKDGALLLNIGNGLLSYVKYLGKMVWPVDLAIFYPLDAASVTPLRVAGALGILACLSAVSLWQWKKRPYLLFGWLWYLITLLPVIGFVRVGSQAMADRYSYVPLIGIFLALVWGGAELARSWRRGPPVAFGAAAAVLLVLSVLTVAQIRYWKTSYDLYAHALVAVPDNWLAHNNMAILLAQQYRFGDAIRHFGESLRINPDQAEGYKNLGNAYQATGDNARAIDSFRTAVQLAPNDVDGHFRLGYAYLIAGSPDYAYQEYLILQRLDESHARPLLDSLRMQTGK
jgi:protein O-mannosyl-transferase